MALTRHDMELLQVQRDMLKAQQDMAKQLAMIASGIDSLVGKHDGIDNGQLRVVIDGMVNVSR
jgi:hypothetical protein